MFSVKLSQFFVLEECDSLFLNSFIEVKFSSIKFAICYFIVNVQFNNFQ